MYTGVQWKGFLLEFLAGRRGVPNSWCRFLATSQVSGRYATRHIAKNLETFVFASKRQCHDGHSCAILCFAEVCSVGQPNIIASVSKVSPVYRKLLAKFPGVVNLSGKLPQPCKGVQHHIQTTGLPVKSHFRRLNPARLAIAKADFAKMEAEGICRCSTSSLHMVPKPDGSWRPCVV